MEARVAVAPMLRKRQRVQVPLALLCLDPDAPAPMLRSYNARIKLTFRTRVPGKCCYVRSDGAMARVAMTEAISLRLKTPS